MVGRCCTLDSAQIVTEAAAFAVTVALEGYGVYQAVLVSGSRAVVATLGIPTVAGSAYPLFHLGCPNSALI